MCGSSWSLGSLIFFRVLQGMAGGGLVPVSQSILLESFPRKQHGMAMAIFGLGAMVGPILGPIMGGWITDNWSWRWIFYINIPIGMLSIVMNIIVIEDPPWMKRQKMQIDYWGLVLLAVGLGSLQFVLDKGQSEDWFGSDLIVAFAIVSVFALVLLMINETTRAADRQPEAVQGPDVHHRATVMFFVFFNLFGSIVLLPIYVQSLMGYTSYDAGLVLGPGGIATMLCHARSSANSSRRSIPRRSSPSGSSICAFSTWMMSRFNLQTDFWTFVWPRVTLGLGMGLSFIPLTTLTLSHIPRENMSEASSLYNLLRNLGGSVGIAFTTTHARAPLAVPPVEAGGEPHPLRSGLSDGT